MTGYVGWAVVTSLGVVGCALGCSEDFNDVGDAEMADGGSGGSDAKGSGGSDTEGSGGSNTEGSGGSMDGGSTTKSDSSSSSSSGGAVGTYTVATTNNTTGSFDSARCDDGLINGTETDLDCGGESCPGCGEGQECYYDSDCDDLKCLEGECSSDELPETCTDGEMNDTETDVDCGGQCAACDTGSICETPDDCASNRCVQGQCEPARSELENCSASPAAVVEYDTNQELEQLLIGAWLLCPDYTASYPYEPVNAIGIEFTSDYRYNYLFENEDGEIVRGEGIDLSGTWYADSDNQGATTVAYPEETILVTPSNDPSLGERYYRLTFTEEPVQLREGVWGIFQSERYVPVVLPD
ncbi:MAG TPA: hypothetical protein VFU02_18455 [Polyangiaceae bacterium]|nr:hypothetical protein [Polyangiaceae bacterium]